MPILPRKGGVVFILLALDAVNGQDRLDGLADAHERDAFDEGFAEATDEGLSGGGRLVFAFGGQVEVEVVGVVWVWTGGEGCDGEDWPFGLGDGGGGLEAGFEGLEEGGIIEVHSLYSFEEFFFFFFLHWIVLLDSALVTGRSGEVGCGYRYRPTMHIL